MKRIMSSIGRGLIAGIFGTFILNVITYLDMVVQGRQASSVPAQLVGRIGETANLDSIAEHNQTAEASARRGATGALMGYATGVSLGIAYGVLRSFRQIPAPIAGIGLGIGAMAASDIPATAARVTNPKTWSASNWVSDLVPHIAFGLATAGMFERFAGRARASNADPYFATVR